tara:strand:- start:2127 stop:2888 length:762 start_codon:yes stop_codon:yes gene_type:complete
MTKLSINDVSVLIPAFNAQHTIQRAVDSVLNGNNSPKEIIIYNDASTDGTLVVIRNLYGVSKKIKIITTKFNAGAGIARQRLLEEASGDLIAFLDADDEWLENKLLKQVEIINSEKADLCICGYEVYDFNHQYIGTRVPPKKINYLNMHFANWIPTSMVLFRASLKNSKKMSELRRRQDYAFWLNLLRSNPTMKISVTPTVLGKYHRQIDSLSSSKLTNLKLNYKMFRTQTGYSILLSVSLVCLNVVTRIFRT